MSFLLKTTKIINDWTDYNGHLNVAFYVRIFDIAADVMLDNFNMGGISAKKDKKTTFVAEMHTTYNQEVRLGEEVETLSLDFEDLETALETVKKLQADNLQNKIDEALGLYKKEEKTGINLAVDNFEQRQQQIENLFG